MNDTLLTCGIVNNTHTNKKNNSEYANQNTQECKHYTNT